CPAALRAWRVRPRDHRTHSRIRLHLTHQGMIMSAPTATVARPSRLPFSATLYRIEAIRQLRNPYTLIFTLILPAAMYLLFGVSMSYGDMSAGHGNIKWYVMVSMAAFGTATAMSSLCSLAASEVRQGWGRQIAMSDRKSVV